MDHFSRLSAIIVIALIVVGGGLVYMFGRPVTDQLITNTTNLNTNQAIINSNINTIQPSNLNDDATTDFVDQVSIALVLIGDDGQAGTLIGCGDSLVMVPRPITPTQAPLRSALEALLTYDPTVNGQPTYTNVLRQSILTIDRVAIENGIASVDLSGTLQLSGVCDNPRMENQLVSTIKQFSTVQTAVVTINDRPLAEVVSGQ